MALPRLLAGLCRELKQTFRSLANPNYKRYALGQIISLTGSQIQGVALAWITYAVTESASKLGMVTAATYLPALLLGLIGGMVADRFDRRKVLVWCQLAGTALAVALAALFWSGTLSFPVILAFGLAQGLVAAIELPSRQAFVYDVVGSTDVVNAVSLNSFMFNASRLGGPALAALILPTLGETACFLLNAASFLVATVSLLTVKPNPRTQEERSHAAAAPLLSGLKFVLAAEPLRNIILLVGCTSFFAFQYSVLLPVFVARVVGGSAMELGLLTAAAAGGSLCGNLLLASRGKPEMLSRIIALTSFGPGLFLFLFSLMTSTFWAAAALFCLGGSIAMQLGSSNSFLQLRAIPALRGRIMSIYTMVLIGAVPVGSLILGYLADYVGVAQTLSGCGACCLAFAVFYLSRNRKEDTSS